VQQISDCKLAGNRSVIRKSLSSWNVLNSWHTMTIYEVHKPLQWGVWLFISVRAAYRTAFACQLPWMMYEKALNNSHRR